MAEVTYVAKRECVICQQEFDVTFVRSRLSLIRQDTDFCAYYKDVNPYYYTVWVCPHCGYAARDTDFSQLPAAGAEKVRAFLKGRDVRINLTGQRTHEQAVVSYQLAIFFAQMIAAPSSTLAGLQLRLAWLYRESAQGEEELRALSSACELYDLALGKERMPIGNLSEAAVTYLVADLLRRTGNTEKAKLYLSRLVSNPRVRLEKRISDMARDLWQEIREQKDG